MPITTSLPPTVVFSGASGAHEATAREKAWLDTRFVGSPVRGYSAVIGQSLEAQFPLGLALALVDGLANVLGQHDARQDLVGQGASQRVAVLRLHPIVHRAGRQFVEGCIIGHEHCIGTRARQRGIEPRRLGQSQVAALLVETGGDGRIAGLLDRLRALFGRGRLLLLSLVAAGKRDQPHREGERNGAPHHLLSPIFPCVVQTMA